MTFLYMLVFAYLLGSIPFGKIMGRRHGIDIQQHGSGNIGFANCLRILGWKPSLVVLAGDVAKGFVPTFIALPLLTPLQVQLVAMVAVIGHIFPVWLGFRGGKGIATGLGVALALNPAVALLAGSVWLVCYLPTRKNSLASLIMLTSLPLIVYVVSRQYLPFSLCFAAASLWAHRSNIARLLANREPKLKVHSAR